MKNKILFTVSLLVSSIGFAWVPHAEVSGITQIIAYGDGPMVMLRLESGIYCNLPNTEGENKKVYAMALMMKTTGAKAEFHCYDAVDNVGGYPSHRLHRIIMQ